jgi:Fe-S-cluster containining protein
MTAPSSISNGSIGAAGDNGTATARIADQSVLCTECALKGHSCCHAHDIYVTWGDCRRIFKHTGRKDFFEYRPCACSAYADQDDDPIWKQHVFRADGSRRVLRQDPKGDCMLLTPAGCSLPLEVRPLVCRLYPHVYSAAGIAWEWDLECPATRSFAPTVIETGIAGVGWSEAAQWHQLLYDEVLWEGLVDEHWFDL